MNSLIETLNQFGGQFLQFAWPMLWQSSLLIGFVLALDFLLARKIRASVRCALWLAVLVKLLLPPTLALPTGAAWWLIHAKPVVKAPVIRNYTVTYDTTPQTDFVPQTIPIPPPEPPQLNGTGWALLATGAISTGLLLWLALRWWQVARMVRGATVSQELAGLGEEVRRQAGLRSRIRLKLVEGRMSPAVCGLFRPVILLPRTLAENLSPTQLRAVLLHEVFHLRRKDVWVNCAQALLQIVYWWHPLLWIANARIRRVREEAVDDAVMLALRDEADSYAPTLLEVAKLAFRRPLMSLGLVGIMESRSALRQRIERLVDFRAPRKAGLTLASLCGICVFSAVALPMGEAPNAADKSNPPNAIGAAITEEQSLTLRVNPEIFFRNLKAQAPNVMQSPTNNWSYILLELLRDEGVDCNPPHGLAFTNATGDITTQNTPEQLAIFRRVIEQLNRADGKCELPLGNNPWRKNVLIEGRIYPMSDGEFDKFTSGMQHYSGKPFGDDWWSVPPEMFKQFVNDIEASGLRPIRRPRIQTSSGIAAELYVGDRTNGLDLTCRPVVGKGFVDLTLASTVVSGAPMNAVTNHVSSKASAEDRGGIVLRMANYDGQAGSNLVVVISAEILTNVPAHFHERLQTVIQRAGRTNIVGITGVLSDSNFNAVIHALEQRGGAATLAEPEVTTTSGRSINRIATPISAPVSKADAGQLVQDGKLLYEMGKLDEAEVKLKQAQALDPDNSGAIYYMNLIQQTKFARESAQHTVDTNAQMPQVKKQWVLPAPKVALPNANGTNKPVYTGPGRQAIINKLDHIRLDNVSFDNLPLSEVLRMLAKQSRLRDPAHEGINFLINSNPDKPWPAIDPATGLPVAPTPADTNSEPVDVGSFIVNIHSLTDVRLADVLDAIVITCDHPIQYSIQDFAVVFSVKGPEVPQLFSRSFKVDPDIFYSSLESGKNTNSPALISAAARKFFTGLGVDLESPKGKSVYYNDRRGWLFVKATESDLDTIERAISALNQVGPQIHIKARFLEVPKGTLQGFKTRFVTIHQPGQTNQSAGLTGILTGENFKTVWKNLENQPGVKALAEPEVETTSGRQTQMRATQTVTILTNSVFEEFPTNHDGIVGSIIAKTGPIETGPVFDVVPYVLSDGYTLYLQMTASSLEFYGYADIPTNLPPLTVTTSTGETVNPPRIWPAVLRYQKSAHVNLFDNQTVILSLTNPEQVRFGEPDEKREAAVAKLIRATVSHNGGRNDILVFVTATIVDPAGNRVHSDDDLPFAKDKIPPQSSQ